MDNKSSNVYMANKYDTLPVPKDKKIVTLKVKKKIEPIRKKIQPTTKEEG